ncbi:hypothetical protein L486_04573 [Kwoniella mangroviensis CBS 10435]|uniref:Uncharacterized protein n=1 Tax=Kwoniella mangroviensis CBS 10435 TaxID=1331196 RepID=A0A1B9ISR6_9TREE|nr:hypothetical protein L486_04573 [Kwoniella mangroviensis CBS 10435]OCF78547.1 hypothetical protein I204_00487 [Kwoniella mangroviensis CBS 8886]
MLEGLNDRSDQTNPTGSSHHIASDQILEEDTNTMDTSIDVAAPSQDDDLADGRA